ncbi:pantoate--beta-alanine ligase [Amnibacterium endophyticum]|uniref:Pantothenate synthetase n=1 Tax=Amnibacterium endophyticum TaxID=2109337 RepID=A0ABW4LGA0_9MICO
MTTTVTTIAGLRERLAATPGARVALVPTMGALHAGHLALVARAREIADVVVVSVFVNPLQFGRGEDLERYPRDLAADEALLEGAGADLVFAPPPEEVYPEGEPQVRVTAGPVGALYEGAVRPGHFDGVLTVVLKLLHVAGPDAVVFGQKDAQQVFLVRRMVADLDVPVRVEVVGIVREDDGLAMSSRNRYLDAAHRRLARGVPAALDAAEAARADGTDAMVDAAGRALGADAALDYLAVVDPESFLPVPPGYRGPALVLVAARVGGTRLIDNRSVPLG